MKIKILMSNLHLCINWCSCSKNSGTNSSFIIQNTKIFEDRLRDAKNIRKNDALEHPFGGASILAVGDFFQLPPVKQGYVFEMGNTNG